MRAIKTVLYTILIAALTSFIWIVHTVDLPTVAPNNTPVLKIIFGALGYGGVVILIAYSIWWLSENWDKDR